MREAMQAIIHKAEVMGLAVNVRRTGLSIGDTAELTLMPDGRIGLFALVKRRFIGLVPYRRLTYLGHLGPAAAQILQPAVNHNDHLRVRIVGLTPEHLSKSDGPQVHVSVWGDPRHILPSRRPSVPGLAVDDLPAT